MEVVGLGDPARSVWAKSLDADGAWLPLWQHMDDAAAVAAGLFDRWLPGSVRRILADPFGGDLDAARCAAMFLAGVHDIGKATPAFAVQDPVLAQRMCTQGLAVPATPAELLDRSRVPHALAGYHLLSRWLLARGWSRRRVPAWAVVVGGHHGVPPDSVSVGSGSPAAYGYLYGAGRWTEVQDELLDRTAARTGAEAYLGRWRDIALPQQVQVLTSGLGVLADWIASNEALFGFDADPLPAVREDAARPAAALSTLGLPAPWGPGPAADDAAALFESRFTLPPGAAPRPVQWGACDVADQMAESGLVVIEAPLGEGKTEAAMAAAEILCRRFGGGGVLVALPTQATTDAMFSRVVTWLDTFGSVDEPVGAVTLSHGKARANRVFQGLVRAGNPTQVGLDDQSHGDGCGHSVVAHSWLSGRHKTPLANFVVATIDQLLFAALRSRYLMLRHLGLAGKVVIIDEVHAYDAFMNSYLTRVLTWLGAYGVPVVALSATLPSERRAALVDAYRRGAAGAEDVTPISKGPEGVPPSYPLITWTSGSAVHTRAVPASSRRTSVSVECLGGGADDDLDALISLLRDQLSDGGCAVVIRNTVSRAVRTGEALMRAFPGEVTVSHSRFIAADRLRHDEELLDRFGPPSRETVDRPARHIVVATQVIEQSLDVDFDLLITDLAPIDLILQRLGRLHRHLRGEGQCDRPPKLRQARMFLTGVDFRCDPPALEPAAADWVYHRYPQLRSAAVLLPRIGGTITLPDDIAPLVEQAYGPAPCGPDEWQTEINRQRERWDAGIESRQAEAAKFQIPEPAAAGRAILGWVSGSVGDADDADGRGQVRDGEPSLEVLLLQHDQDSGWHTPSWLPQGQGSISVPVAHAPSESVAEAMLGCTVRLPVALSSLRIENLLRDQTPPSWNTSKLIHRLPVLLVDHRGDGRVGDRPINYSPELGLQTLKGDPH